MPSKSRKRKHNATQPVHSLTETNLPSALITSAINLVTELLHLTQILTLSVRMSIDKVILSAALKNIHDDDVILALHEAIITIVQFPAEIAVLSHAIQIFENDCGSGSAKVRESAMKKFQTIELLNHPRLPTRGRTSFPTPVNDVREEGVSDDEFDIGLPNENSRTEVIFVEPLENTVPEADITKGPAMDLAMDSNSTPSLATSSLPVFVSAVPAPVAPDTSHEKVIVYTNDSSSTMPPVMQAKNKEEDSFSKGPWRALEEDNDEDCESIPEIDMGWDDDEE